MYYCNEAEKQLCYPLETALLTVALVIMGKKVLLNINTALADSRTAVTDGVLASIMLTGFYEPDEAVWELHRHGRLLLLRLRGNEQFRTRLALNKIASHFVSRQVKSRGRDHFRILHTSVLMGSLLKRKPGPEESFDWLSHFDDEPWVCKATILIEIIAFGAETETLLKSDVVDCADFSV
ncbi:hypothetical protein BDZ45DRAFT_753810 [Acephala macrosclerotiorum]|nr:hypothetical protein BDZ45DRAFT_753810 [Acephala macrosclerotiorum]